MRIEDIVYSGDAVDSSVCGVLQISRTRRRTEIYITFQRAAYRSFCPLEKFIVWQAVLCAHGIFYGPIFVTITYNKLYGGIKLSNSAYADAMKAFSVSCGIPSLK